MGVGYADITINKERRMSDGITDMERENARNEYAGLTDEQIVHHLKTCYTKILEYNELKKELQHRGYDVRELFRHVRVYKEL